MIILVKLILFAVVVGLAAKNLYSTWRDLESRKWPATKATALVSKVAEAPVGARRGFLGTHLWLLKWQYAVNGKAYVSNVTEPFPPTTEANALRMAESIEQGTKFDVRYDPRDPAISRLAVNPTQALVQFLLRVLLYSVGIGVVIWAMIVF